MISLFEVEHIAEEFWSRYGNVPEYPFDMHKLISFALPLHVVMLPDLTLGKIREWCQQRHLEYPFPLHDRPLHGYLIAGKSGFLFIDENDHPSEQRFTAAHEGAHYLFDFDMPRLRAVDEFGEAIVSVLDGERPPTLTEKVHSAISGVPIRVIQHLMERPTSGVPNTAIIDAEDRADRLALELLAPTAKILKDIASQILQQKYSKRFSLLQEHLITEYGLPTTVAATYCKILLSCLGRSIFSDWLED